MTADVDRARPRRPRALRARRLSRTTCGRGCGPRRRSRTSRRRATSRSGRSRSTPTSCEIAKQPLRFSSAQGITLRPRRCGDPAVGDGRHARSAAARAGAPGREPALHAACGARAGATTSSASRSRSSTTAAPAGASGELDFVERIAAPFPLGGDRLDPRRAAATTGQLLFRWTNEVIGKDDPGVPPARARRPGQTEQACARRGARLLPDA